MPELDRMHRFSDTTSPAMEQVIGGEEGSWSPISSPCSAGKAHDSDEDHSHHHKKSVLAKVKEKAKKLRHSLSNKKRHGHDDEKTTPSWGFSLEEEEVEEEEEGADLLGAPMYESELAPEDRKETARQHPRIDPTLSEKRVLATSVKLSSKQDVEKKPIVPKKIITERSVARAVPFSSNKTSAETSPPAVPSPLRKTVSEAAATFTSSPRNTITETKPTTLTRQISTVTETTTATLPSSPRKTLTETVTEKLAPAYSTVTDTTHAIASKIQSFTISSPANNAPTHSSPEMQNLSCPAGKPASSGMEHIWDKGVSVKEYLMHKFEPGEDEKALSRVISEAISPSKSPGETGIFGKVKDNVTSLLRSGEPSQSISKQSDTNSSSSSSNFPISTHAHEVVEEETHERVLQAN